MSYQVLARKWRPRNFHQMVGQSHVLRAVINALDNDRLHHAYLFTGTRGVGKTTIARILAKCLNCEQGVSSTPCGTCGACREIDEGRFVDLIEVDAASRTKVEDTRELLDNVQYAPTRGRYKVYLIDEVHMLSAHSFNALLKTLEEPPPHVKFLLATTDPQKLPVTILSRCLQFSLKNMTPERIVGHLEHVLTEEQVGFETPALWALGRAADGSMRDALSLLDQAIAFGDGQVNESEVAAMLGTLDRGQVYGLAEALAQQSAEDLLAQIAKLSELAPDYGQILADLLALLHRIALAQLLPQGIDNSQGDRDQVLALAQQMLSEDVQLYYQVGLHGRRDLPLAPEPRIGFEMALLRMLAFRPDGVPNPPQELLPGAQAPSESVAEPQAEDVNAAQNLEVGAPADSGSVPSEKTLTTREPPEVTAPVKKPLADSAGICESAAESAVQATAEDALEASTVSSATIEGDSVATDNTQASVAPQQTPVCVPVTDPVVTPAESTRHTQHQSLDAQQQPQNADEHSCSPLPISVEPAVLASESPVADQVTGWPQHTGAADEADLQADEQAYSDYAAGALSDTSVQPPVALAESTPAVISAVESQASIEHAAPLPKAQQVAVPEALDALDRDSWIALCPALGLGGVTGTVISHSEFIACSGCQVALRVDEGHGMLFNPTHQDRISRALKLHFKEPELTLEMTLGAIEYETPAQHRERVQAQRLAAARQKLYSDPLVKQLQDDLAAEVLDHTIAPID